MANTREFHYIIHDDTGEVQMFGGLECPICGIKESHSHWIVKSTGDVGSLVTFPGSLEHDNMKKRVFN